MLRLDRIQVKGFKSIWSMDLELHSLNVLIGANGSGKSNFTLLFSLLNQLASQNLQLFVGRLGGADRLLHYGQKVTDSIKIDLCFADGLLYQCELVPSYDDTLIFAREEIYQAKTFSNGDEPLGRTNLGVGHKESKLHICSQKIARQILEAMKSWRVYHFHDTSSSAKVKQTQDIDDNWFLREDGSNLAAYLYLLQQRDRAYYANIVDTIRMVAPFFDDFILRPSPLNSSKIKLAWREKGSRDPQSVGINFDAAAFSDGTLRFISLATLLLQPQLPTTILLDEPELGLHPYAIGLLSDLLRSAATKSQVIVCTQSVTLINQFAPEEIIVVERQGGHSTLRQTQGSAFERLVPEEIALWLEEYDIGELWEKNVVGGRPS